MSKSPIKEFASFHNHSHFSVFDGLSRPEEILQAAKDKGLKSVAITEHGNTHSHADWYLFGKKIGIKSVYGIEAYVIHDLIEWKELKEKYALDKKAKKNDDEFADDGDIVDGKMLRRKGHLVILARNREGLSNLYQLSYKAHKFGFYGKPRMDKVMLRAHAPGLIATSACMGGVISKRLWDFKEGACTWADVVQEVREYNDIFGFGHFFLEIQYNEMDKEQNYINTMLVKLSEETGTPLTTTTDSHYSKAEEWAPRELLHLMGWSKKTVQDLPGGKLDATIKQLYVKSPEEMWETYVKFARHCITPSVAQKAFENTLLIDELIEDFEPDVHQRLPTLPYENPMKEMGLRAIAGLKKLGLANNEVYKNRLLFELGVIKQKGIANYFMVCQRMIDEARKHMLVGPGRGSAPGSLVCWTLGITDLDPIKLDLLFERFLDIDRAELPDIDTDFEDPKQAKRLLKEMFGEDNVASLSSYGTFQVKGLLKDLGRVYGVDHQVVNKVNRAIEKELKILFKDQDKSTLVIKLEDLERVSPSFNAFTELNPELGSHIKALYGRIRHVTRHAAGVIIGDNLPAETSVFVVNDKKEGETIVQTSFTEGIVNKNLSAMGFVKLDILGLANLRIINYAIELITGEKKGEPKFEAMYESLRSHNIDLDDLKVMKHIFWNGNFGSIFQFTNPGIRALAKRVKPDSFTDISAICSLYRPGPLKGGYDRVYVNAKHGEVVSLGHPLLDKLLGATKGCLVFQEQLMKVCSQFGKMTGKEVNRVRKVLLKKDKTKTDEYIQNENDTLYASFHKGCMEHGFPEDKTLKLWEDIKAFGGYAFNKAHSDAYSLTTMQTAHLATYYPLQFYTAALTRAQAGEVQNLVSDILKTGIKVLPVDINKSGLSNTIEGADIRLRFTSVLGVGEAAVAKIVAGQPYTDFIDFLDRSGASKTAISPLIRVGAFDCLEPNIKKLENFYNLYTVNPKWRTKKHRDTCLLAYSAAGIGTTLPGEEKDYEQHEKYFMELELLEFSTKGSPFEILGRMDKIEKVFGEQVKTLQEFFDGDDEIGILPVALKDIKERPQRNGQMFAFLKWEVPTGETFEAPCFSTIWKNISHRMRKGGVYIATFNRKEDDPEALVLGKPGFKHSPWACQDYVISVDEIEL